jgi:hypothetical protein
MSTPNEKGAATMNLSPTSIPGWMLLTLRARLDRACRGGERGASAIEWVIITAVLVALAAAVGWFIYNLVTERMDEIDVPDLPDDGGI